MKNLFTIAAAMSLVAFTTPALAEPMVTGEVHFGDARGGARADSTEYRVEAWDTIGKVNVGAELQANQAAREGELQAAFSVKAGVDGPSYFGVQTAVYGELGGVLADGNNGEFWGAGVKLTRPIFGSVSVVAGYRHREGFANDYLNEDRLNLGLSYAFSDKTSFGAGYYRTRGTFDNETVGVSVTRNF